jgi:hypothetical protein
VIEKVPYYYCNFPKFHLVKKLLSGSNLAKGFTSPSQTAAPPAKVLFSAERTENFSTTIVPTRNLNMNSKYQATVETSLIPVGFRKDFSHEGTGSE